MHEMHDSARWSKVHVYDADSGEERWEVWYEEHDGTKCHRYNICDSPMMRDTVMYKGVKVAHDTMLGLVATRRYDEDEIITVYTGEDIGAVDGEIEP